MDKRKFLRTVIELGKDVLIIGLTCSALWMLRGGGLWQRVSLVDDRTPGITEQQASAEDRAAAARPMSITATIQGGIQPERCVIRYDDSGVDTMFRQLAGILVETLSSVEEPAQIDREAWEAALAQSPGFCFDFQGELPLSVLSGWLGVERELPEVTMRRLLLTMCGKDVALYCYDLAGERWLRFTTGVVSEAQLENALEGLVADGAYYAFESETTANMSPDTVLTPAPEPMPVCVASNPVVGGRSALEGLMSDLNINLSGCVFYPAAGEEVARIGSDTLRLSTAGVLEYHADEESARQFPVTPISGKSEIFAVVESCRQLLRQVTAERCGQARVYLADVEQTARGWRVEFEYSLNGVGVALEKGCAAVFDIRNGHITAFTLRLRSYTQGEETQPVLPPVQAAAAMSALSLRGRELRLVYSDRGEGRLVPNWMAVMDRAG